MAKWQSSISPGYQLKQLQSGETVTKYLFDQSGPAASIENSGPTKTILFFRRDHKGNITHTFDTAGTIQSVIAYDGYGLLKTLSGANNFGPKYEGKVNALKHYNKPIVFNEDWCFSDDTRRIGDAVEKLTTAFKAGASWGIMNQIRNQQYPFIFEIGKPNEGENATLDFQAYERMAELIGIQ